MHALLSSHCTFQRSAQAASLSNSKAGRTQTTKQKLLNIICQPPFWQGMFYSLFEEPPCIQSVPASRGRGGRGRRERGLSVFFLLIPATHLVHLIQVWFSYISYVVDGDKLVPAPKGNSTCDSQVVQPQLFHLPSSFEVKSNTVLVPFYLPWNLWETFYEFNLERDLRAFLFHILCK